MWKMLLIVSGAGALGGLLNALMGGAGFILPHLAVVAGSHILAPGFIGNVLAGAVAAPISFGLYGPFSSMPILKAGQSPQGAPPVPAQLTLAALAGAALVRLLWQSVDHGRGGQAVQSRDGGGHRAARGGSGGGQGIIERDENPPSWHAVSQLLGGPVPRTLRADKVPAGSLRRGREVEQRGQVRSPGQTGGYAASPSAGSGSALIPGYQRWNVACRSSFRTRVRTCSSR